MLKLNSNYAKAYLRDAQEQRIKPPNTQRFYPSSNDYDQPKRQLQDTDYRREKFDYRQVNNSTQLKNDYPSPHDYKANKQKTYGYSYHQTSSNYQNEESLPRKDFAEYPRKTRTYDEPLNDIDSNYNYKEVSPKTMHPMRNNYAPSYQFELPTKNDQNYEGEKDYRFSKYAPSSRPAVEPTFDKKQYAPKHSRRNEQVKNRLVKQQSYNREPVKNAYQERQQAYDNYLNQPNPYQTYRNQQEQRDTRQEYPSAYKNPRKLQFETFEKLDERKPERQFKNYDLSAKQYPEQPLLSKKKSQDYPVERLDRPHLHERKEAIKKSIQSTPQKNYKGNKLQPGSAEKKNSLIEKSQMLQEKLKKLNMQYPVGLERERQKQVNNDQNYQYQRQTISRPSNEETYARYTPSSNIQVPAPAPNVSNRSTSCLRNSFRNVNIGQPENITAANRNADILRTKSPILESQGNGQMPNKGEAIQKITKLNEKINERIQSIISNYAKK